ncbi:MAG: 50S ribosomal protein L11 methyltransferase [Clostridia bacterium]|nr:50S ribosomal protein L11 methyltransferase [Clostridia bacterium]
MKYVKIDIEKIEDMEVAIAKLLDMGISDVVIEDPADVSDLLNKEKDYEWDYVDDKVLDLKNREPRITIYVEGLEEGLSRFNQVKSTLTEYLVSNQVLDDTDWKDNWKEFFKPTKISDSIVVKPTWYDYDLKDGELLIEIDPGMAFGTGTHETTSLCVKMMEKYLKPGQKVLDVGAGSGILSIAAAKLGCKDVLGVEIDPVAVEIAKENVKLNQVDYVDIREGDLTKGLDFKANLVVANLMADLVMMLSKDVSKHLEKGGIYISSGILNEKVDLVSGVIKECGFEILEVKADGMWSVIVGRKNE